MITVRSARPDRSAADLDVVAGTLARAFAEDPLVVWLLGPDVAAAAGRRRILFRTLARHEHGRDGGAVDVAEIDGEPAGAALWDRPAYAPGPIRAARTIPGYLAALRQRTPRGMRLRRSFARHRPAGDFWYLAELGASVPGRGVGSALLEHRLDAVTGAAYLESSNEANLPLYERYGFRVLEQVRLPGGGPSYWPMVRR